MSYKNIELSENEELIMSGAANKIESFGNKDGMLFLTSTRLVFKANALNVGNKVFEYKLTQIRKNSDGPDIRIISNTEISTNISIGLVSGEDISFAVIRKQEENWINAISKAV